MSKIANKQMICEVLMDAAKTDRDIVALCSDSRGSGSFTPFADTYPEQFVETGIAEQNSGLSHWLQTESCAKKHMQFLRPAFFPQEAMSRQRWTLLIPTQMMKLIGISGGVSYGALGMSHHSAQDIAAMAAIPNMRVYIPATIFRQGNW